MKLNISRDDWTIQRLGDFVISAKGKKPKNQSDMQTDIYKYPYVDIQGFEKNIFDSYTDGQNCTFCTEDDFLMVWDGSRSGLVGKAVNGAIGSTLVKINLPKIENLFAYYFLKSKYIELNTNAKGTGTPHVNPDLLWNYSFPIVPLLEQKAIIAKIEQLFSELDNGIQNLKTAQAKLRIYRQAVLQKAFEGEFTRKWREKQIDLPTADELFETIKQEREEHYHEQLRGWEEAIKEWSNIGKKPNKPTKLSNIKLITNDSLSKIPQQWFWIKSEYISDFITKGTTPSANELLQNEGEIPFLKVYNLTFNSTLDFTINPTYISELTHKNFLKRSIVYPNDVLMNIVGPPLGKVSIVPSSFPEWNINQAIVRFRPIKSVLSKYLAYYLSMHETIQRVSKKAKATAGQLNLTLEICREIEIPTCSFHEQIAILEEIESRLSVCDKIEETISDSLIKAESLRQSILKKAFEGKLLNAQELEAIYNHPDYESAEKLLKRIKQERAK